MTDRMPLLLGCAGIAGLLFGATALAYGAAPTSSSLNIITRAAAIAPVPLQTVAPLSELYRAGGGPFAFANPFAGVGRFELVWNRVDLPVKQGKVRRSWVWGPGPNTPGLLEQYDEDPTGRLQRLVQYFDKARMEMNNPYADENTAGYTTNGLLSVELISGFIQAGDSEFVPYHPACIPMSGDPGDQLAPTYLAFQGVSNTQAGDHPSPNLTGRTVVSTIDRDGKIGNDPSKASIAGARLVQYEGTTQHNMPGVFWDFLNASGPVYEIVYSGNRLTNERNLSTQPLGRAGDSAAGLPISEPYWSKATIRGKVTDVMIQAYERWVLTYVPTNPAGFQVEVANIGQHYFDWRYRNAGICPGTPPSALTPPVAAPRETIPAITPTLVFPTYAPTLPKGSVTPPPTAPLPTGTNTPLPLPTVTP